MSPKPPRTRDLAAIHAAKRDRGLDDDTYRALLERVAGMRSAADLDGEGRRRVLAEFKRMGWRGTGRRRSTTPAPAMARVLWHQLHQAGAVHNPSDQALTAFARRMAGVDHWRWTGRRTGLVIEALKAWLARVELQALWARCHAAGCPVPQPSEATIASACGVERFGRIRAATARAQIDRLNELLQQNGG